MRSATAGAAGAAGAAGVCAEANVVVQATRAAAVSPAIEIRLKMLMQGYRWLRPGDSFNRQG
ncbi:hypothetical protein GCM10007880_52190 [Mesorhizobium amorphae]|nr:hypothetical protein GCM10007880_52190 [Mesorhizobium amorphae]